jgi:glycosyltransferase involved in cell wall biosynthesis
MARDIPTLECLPAPPAGRSDWPWTKAPKPLPPRRSDGSAWPRISIVTGSHNQGAYLEETLRSVLLQGYPNLEYIVIDGGSSDDSLRIIQRYAPWLARWEAQPDRGQAAALNSGFAHASGAILGFLNSDDTYLPGALERAGLEVDARRDRHLVIGRCLFVDSAGCSVGNEHTSRAVSHLRLLAAWKGNTIPQPASFWSRAAWTDAGPLIEEAGAPWIDYGLFCRMTRRHRIHAVDQVLATYRLHPKSITVTAGGTAREGILRISRRYWGPAWTPRHLALATSLTLHRLDRLGRARAVVRSALARRARGQRLRAFALTSAAALCAPDLVFQLAIERRQASGPPRLADSLTTRATPRAGMSLERTEPWHDRWVGPHLHLDLEAAGGERCLRIVGTAERAFLGAPLRLLVRVGGLTAGQAVIDVDGPFAVELALPATVAPGRCRVEIAAAPYFLPDTILGNSDKRSLCWLIQTVELIH